MLKKYITAFFSILLVVRPFLSSIAYPTIDIFYTMVLMLTGFLLLKRGDFSFRGFPASFFAMLFLLAILVSLCLSQNMTKSLFELYKHTAQILIFFAVAYLEKDQKRIVILTMLITSFLVSFYAIYWLLNCNASTLDYLYNNRIKWDFAFEYLSRGRAFVPFFSPSLLGSYIILFVPLSFAFFSTNTRNADRKKSPAWMSLKNIVLFLVVYTICLALLATQSMGAILSLMAAFSVFVLLRRKKINENYFILAILVFLISFFFFLVLRYSNIHLINLPFFSIQNRLSYWNQALINIGSHPFVGFGLGNYPFFKGLSPHNSYLQIWAEIGILGFIALLGIAYQTIKVKFSDMRPSEKIIFESLWIGNLAFLIHNFIDFSFFMPEVSLQWWVITALLTSQHIKKS